MLGTLFWAIATVVLGGLGAFVYEHYVAPWERTVLGTRPVADSASAALRVREVPKPREAESPLADDVKSLRSQVGDLAKQADGFKDRLDSMSRPEASPNLTMLQLKVADLAKAADEYAALPNKIDRNDSKIERISRVVDSLRTELTAVESHMGPEGTVAPNSTSPPVQPTERREAGKPVASSSSTNLEALARGAALFKQGKYKEALDAFSLLEITDPDDARVWYFAALSRGMATGKWGNGTEQLVERGVERERAGTPKTADIDAAFRDLTSDTGKDWLAAYRERVKEK